MHPINRRVLLSYDIPHAIQLKQGFFNLDRVIQRHRIETRAICPQYIPNIKKVSINTPLSKLFCIKIEAPPLVCKFE